MFRKYTFNSVYGIVYTGISGVVNAESLGGAKVETLNRIGTGNIEVIWNANKNPRYWYFTTRRVYCQLIPYGNLDRVEIAGVSDFRGNKTISPSR